MSLTNGSVNGGSMQNGVHDSNKGFKYIGKPRPIVDGLEKVTGYSKYAGDLSLRGMVYIRPILATMANATILDVEKEDALAIPGVLAVYTADDLPTKDKLINSRQTSVLAKERTLWVGQPVAVVVAETEQAAIDAAELVFIDLDPQGAVTSVLEAIKPDAPKVWPNGYPKADEDLSSLHGNTELGQEAGDDAFNNLQSENHFERGDVEAGFAESEAIVERRFRVSGVHQGYLEPHAVVVDPDPLGRGMTVFTATQNMFAVRSELAGLFDMPQHSIVVKPMVVGGGFGAKYGIYDPLVAAVAMTIKQPSKLVTTRSEDFLSTQPAPEIVIDLKTGAKRDGTMTAIEATIYTNNGVFTFNHGGIVATLIAGFYKWENVKIDAYEVNTFTNPIGAYRAPGAPHASFAVESNLNDLADELGLDYLEFRYQNAVEGGEPTGTGRPWNESLGLKDVLDEARNHPLWKDRKPGDGVGLAVGAWPNFMGNAEVTCRVDTDGRVRLETGIVDISGTKSALVLIAAEALGVDPGTIEIDQGDTTGAYGPGSGGSQVTYTMAGAIHSAALDARQQLLEIASGEFEAAVEDLEIVEGVARVVGVPDKTIEIGTLAQKGRSQRNVMPVMGEGKSAPEKAGPGFVVHLMKVQVDADTGEVKPEKYVAIQDVGLAINPMLVEGQMHGGAIQSLGIGLYEGIVYDEDGQLLTGSFMDYCLPRIDNSPDVEAIIVEKPNPSGLFGARGLAEPAITAGPAALGNAIKDAVGVRVTSTPIRAETVWNAIQNQK
ncbi:MAG: xanthine dehydrogenase family protein molybdopterin-binding subunit [Chloroflexota bacterium]